MKLKKSERLIELCLNHGLTLAVAESVTVGRIQALIGRASGRVEYLCRRNYRLQHRPEGTPSRCGPRPCRASRLRLATGRGANGGRGRQSLRGRHRHFNNAVMPRRPMAPNLPKHSHSSPCTIVMCGTSTTESSSRDRLNAMGTIARAITALFFTRGLRARGRLFGAASVIRRTVLTSPKSELAPVLRRFRLTLPCTASASPAISKS